MSSHNCAVINGLLESIYADLIGVDCPDTFLEEKFSTSLEKLPGLNVCRLITISEEIFGLV